MEKSRKELAAEGEKVLEDAVEAAFQVLSTMNEAFCNPAVWSKPEASRSDHALRYPRRRFKAAVGSLRVLLNSIPHSHMVKILPHSFFNLHNSWGFLSSDSWVRLSYVD